MFYQFTHSFGMAIILLTVLVRGLLFPLTAKQAKSMAAMQRLQPEMKKLQAQYKDDRQKLNEEMMKFYRENKVNPAAGCLPIIVQMPLFYILYRVIRGLTASKSLESLLIRVPRPQHISKDSELYQALVASGGRMLSFGIDLARSASSQRGISASIPYYILVVLVALTGLYQQHQTSARAQTANNPQAQQMQTIMKIFPFFIAFISYNMQAGMVLYWIAGNIFTIIQQAIIFRSLPAPGAVAGVAGAIDAGSRPSKGAGLIKGAIQKVTKAPDAPAPKPAATKAADAEKPPSGRAAQAKATPSPKQGAKPWVVEPGRSGVNRNKKKRK